MFTSSYFGQGTGPILFSGLSCVGTENSLTECFQSYTSYNSYNYSYNSHHYSDIGVRCLQKSKMDQSNSVLRIHLFLQPLDVSCTNGTVRLVNGSTSDEGRVEICINGEWGTVCDSGLHRNETQVVCRQLGYNPSCMYCLQDLLLFIYLFNSGAINYPSSRFGDGRLPILAQSFSCTGTESSLLNCSNTTGYSSCYYGSVVGVRCFSK